MSEKIKAVLIDPYKEEITDVEYSGDYKQIYKLIQADCFTAVSLGDNDDVFVDDEGLMKVGVFTKFFLIGGYPQPLAGYGLILGLNPDDGESVEAHHDAAYYAPKIKFLNVDAARVKSLLM